MRHIRISVRKLNRKYLAEAAVSSRGPYVKIQLGTYDSRADAIKAASK